MRLSEKAMLVGLNISQWTARKYDRKISNEVAANHGTSTDAGRYNKCLVAVEEIRKIQKISSAARIWHYDNTLPWDDSGFRILPSENYSDYSQKMREFKGKFQQIVMEFIRNYPDFVEDAKWRLNGMFNQADYPDVQSIHKRFSFDVNVLPLPDSADFRVSLGQAEEQKIKKEIEDRVQRIQETAMRDLWERLYSAVKHMSDKLGGTKKQIFRDSLVGNLCELTELLPKLNITNDENLEKMRNAVEKALCGYSAQNLRNSEYIRNDTKKKADMILHAMAGYMGE